MAEFKIVCLETDHPDCRHVQDALAELPGAVLFEANVDPLDEAAMIEAVRDADAVLYQWAHVTRAVVEAMEKCKVISTFGIAVDLVDVEAATRKGIADLAEDYDIVINRAYMWPKGETGRLGLYVENGDLEASLEAYIEQVRSEGIGEDPQFAADFDRLLAGEYGVFALTVTASAEALDELNAEADCISYVDVMHNDEAETYAKKARKTVSYIELPSKPDGAL